MSTGLSGTHTTLATHTLTEWDPRLLDSQVLTGTTQKLPASLLPTGTSKESFTQKSFPDWPIALFSGVPIMREVHGKGGALARSKLIVHSKLRFHLKSVVPKEN